MTVRFDVLQRGQFCVGTGRESPLFGYLGLYNIPLSSETHDVLVICNES